MKTILFKNAQTKLNDLYPGDTFYYGGNYYMKIENCCRINNNKTIFNCIDLQNGEFEKYNSEVLVNIIECECIVK